MDEEVDIGLVVLVTTLLAAAVALGDVRYTNSAGDSGNAADVTAVTAANDTSGKLTLTVATNQQALADQAVLTLFFDSDGDSSTGGNGVEYYLIYGGTGGILYHWNGSRFVEATASSLHVEYANGVLTFKINKADLNVVDDLVFYVVSQKYDVSGAIVASDHAPDGTGGYDYTLSAPRPLTLLPPPQWPRPRGLWPASRSPSAWPSSVAIRAARSQAASSRAR